MKDEKVKIIQIISHADFDGLHSILGLGDDSKIYGYDYGDGKWYLYKM